MHVCVDPCDLFEAPRCWVGRSVVTKATKVSPTELGSMREGSPPQKPASSLTLDFLSFSHVVGQCAALLLEREPTRWESDPWLLFSVFGCDRTFLPKEGFLYHGCGVALAPSIGVFRLYIRPNPFPGLVDRQKIPWVAAPLCGGSRAKCHFSG